MGVGGGDKGILFSEDEKGGGRKGGGRGGEATEYL